MKLKFISHIGSSHDILILMRIIARSMLRDFWARPNRADARIPLEAWFRDTIKAQWSKPGDIKQAYRNASFIADNRVVFNIAGNKYRLIVHINYEYQTVYTKFIGTHKDYDKIDAANI